MKKTIASIISIVAASMVAVPAHAAESYTIDPNAHLADVRGEPPGLLDSTWPIQQDQRQDYPRHGGKERQCGSDSLRPRRLIWGLKSGMNT